MARIQPPKRQPILGRFLQAVLKRRYKRPFPAVALLGHHEQYPFAYAVFSSIFGLAKTRLEPEVKRLAMQLVAEINGCAFCIDLGKRLAKDEKLELAKLQHVLEFEQSPEYSAAEKAALAYAFEATQVGARVADETFQELKQHFDDKEIMELTIAIATENFFNRLNAPLGIEAQGFCTLPESASKQSLQRT
jgi:AhpD family alkylhydroperoxidase